MSAPAITPPPFITERADAIDALLDARVQLAAVRDSALPGTALYLCMERAIYAVDSACNELRP